MGDITACTYKEYTSYVQEVGLILLFGLPRGDMGRNSKRLRGEKGAQGVLTAIMATKQWHWDEKRKLDRTQRKSQYVPGWKETLPAAQTT